MEGKSIFIAMTMISYIDDIHTLQRWPIKLNILLATITKLKWIFFIFYY